jgi:muramidase (phage lysozyme)
MLVPPDDERDDKRNEQLQAEQLKPKLEVPYSTTAQERANDEFILRAVMTGALLNEFGEKAFFPDLIDHTNKIFDRIENATTAAGDWFKKKTGIDATAFTRSAVQMEERIREATTSAERAVMSAERAVRSVFIPSGNYFKDLAHHESGRKGDAAKAGTSTAAGRFQFLKGTWLGVVKQHGNDAGVPPALREAAQHIHSNGRGYFVDAGFEKQILDMRHDPSYSIPMAKAFTSDNAAVLKRHDIGSLSNTDLYMAHFMGPVPAASFIKRLRSTPEADARSAVSDAVVKANHNVFYDRSGNPRSIQQVYTFFGKDFHSGAPASPGTMLAGSGHRNTANA